MIFQQLYDKNSSTLTYILGSRVGGRAIIIDPVYENIEQYLSILQRCHLSLLYAFDTHTHADHISGRGKLRDLTKCITVTGKVPNSDGNLSAMQVTDGDTLSIDDLKLTAMYTPGHTNDSYCLYADDFIFTGDTLFIGGSGRTDFQNGSPEQAYHSLFEKIFQLNHNTLTYPGHDYKGNRVSTLSYELSHNPRLQIKNKAEYCDIMNNLNLAKPKMMDVAPVANESMQLDAQKRLSPENNLSVDALKALCASTTKNLIIDLREMFECKRDGKIQGALHYPYSEFDNLLSDNTQLQQWLSEYQPSNIIFIGAFGLRSVLAIEKLASQGFAKSRHLLGGIAAWLKAGYNLSDL